MGEAVPTKASPFSNVPFPVLHNSLSLQSPVFKSHVISRRLLLELRLASPSYITESCLRRLLFYSGRFF